MRRVPSAPGMPVGEWPGWRQHPGATARRSSLGRAWNVGPEGLGLGQQCLGSAGSDGQLGRAGHACSCLCVSVHVCSCMCVHRVALSSELALGKGGNARGGRTREAESGRSPWLVSAAQGWIRPGERAAPVLGAGLASSSSKHPLHQARAGNLCSPPWVLPPSCTRCRPRVPLGGRVPPLLAISSLPTRCFELYILKK